jgi:hypothetical protein
MCGVYRAGTRDDLLTHALDLLTLRAVCNSVRADALAGIHFPEAFEEPTCDKCFNILVRLKAIK